MLLNWYEQGLGKVAGTPCSRAMGGCHIVDVNIISTISGESSTDMGGCCREWGTYCAE
jgi:hypothetical protein